MRSASAAPTIQTWSSAPPTWPPSTSAATASARSTRLGASRSSTAAPWREPMRCLPAIVHPGAPATSDSLGVDNPTVDRQTCLSFDRQDPLASLRDEFTLPEGVIYLDGNSLGALPRQTLPRLNEGIG